MSTDETHSGIPTRAIHEAYLDMQRALKAYREAKDSLVQAQIDDAHGELQQSVVTFYELLRPYLKNEDGISGYWEGELPNYKRNSIPDPEEGKGILQTQKNTDVTSLDTISGNPQTHETLEDWHDALGLNGNVRIIGIAGKGQNLLVTTHQYEKGLKRIDDWDTDYKRKVTDKGGFMKGKKETTIERVRVPIDRLKNAARELAEAAEKLGALSNFDASEPRTEIPKELIEDVEEWRQENIQ